MLFPHESWDYWIPKREFLTFSMIKWNTMKISFRNDLEYEIFPSWMLLLLLRFDTPHLNQIKEARFRFILSKNFSFSNQTWTCLHPWQMKSRGEKYEFCHRKILLKKFSAHRHNFYGYFFRVLWSCAFYDPQ